jgi:multisubunit Na+/H+ antiporter MnhG subunit
MKILKKLFPAITTKQSVEFGQVSILVAITLAWYLKEHDWVITAFLLTLTTILVPIAFYPFAVLWVGLAGILSRVSSAIILTILFFLLVTPVGLFRRMLGRDSLKLNQFKKGRQSVMVARNHRYTPADLLDTF